MAKGIKGSGPTDDIPARTTFIIRPSVTEKLKYIALMDKTTQTAIIDKLLSGFVERWEKKNGPIPV
jgi:hypothetical protein